MKQNKQWIKHIKMTQAEILHANYKTNLNKEKGIGHKIARGPRVRW